MAITLFFYPWDSQKQDWSSDAIPFVLGEMTVDYYNRVGSGSLDIYGGEHYGIYMDNVISRGSNIYDTLIRSGATFGEIGITPSLFLQSQNTVKLTTQYKISDDLFADMVESFTFYGNSSTEKATVSCTWQLIFKSPLVTYQYSITPALIQTFGLEFFGSNISITYQQFYEKCDGKNPLGAYGRIGYIEGLNSYPYASDLVEEAKNTTGICLQNYSIFRSYSTGDMLCLSPKTKLYGKRGTEITNLWVDSDSQAFYVALILGNGFEPVFPESEPEYIPGGYENDSDVGSIPSLPNQSALSSGMVRMFQMSTAQLNAFANFLWNDSLADWDKFVNTLKQWFNNPLDSIISLSISPVDIFHNYTDNTDSEPMEREIKLGGFGTGVNGYQCSTNYKQISLGKMSLKPYYNSFLDCNPHTKFSLYLPYIGFKDLDSDVLFSTKASSLEIVYSIDVMTGVCVANILIEKESNGTHLKHVLYSFTGNMNTTIPITSANMKDFISATIGAVASGVAIAGSGGSLTPVVAGAMITEQAMNIASQKSNVAHSGGMSLEAGIFGIQYAYLIVTRPREARPKGYETLNGIPAEIGGTLGSFAGYTQVNSVNVSIEGATDEEKNEIERLLKEGIII